MPNSQNESITSPLRPNIAAKFGDSAARLNDSAPAIPRAKTCTVSNTANAALTAMPAAPINTRRPLMT
jgi:hypothetical protein